MSGIKTFNKKSRKGISPVIATVILVAVAVVVAAALAGFSSSLFGSYSSQGAAVNVKTIEVSAAGTFDLDMVNNGNTADKVVSVSIPPNAASPIGVAVGDLAPHSTAFTNGAIAAEPIALGGAVAGNTVTVKINMQSGLQLTQSVIVGP